MQGGFFPLCPRLDRNESCPFGNSVGVRKTLSVTQCPKFKATVSISVAINPLGDRDRNNLKTAVWQILLNPCTVVYLVLCTSPDLQLSILIIPPSPLAQKAVTTKKKIMNSVDVVTKVALLPKGEFHNLKISQKQDKREQ